MRERICVVDISGDLGSDESMVIIEVEGSRLW